MSRLPGPNRSLTGQQRRVLNYVGAFLASEGHAPSLAEIRDHLGLAAVSTVYEHVQALIRKGYLSRRRYRSRSISLGGAAKHKAPASLIPVTGSVVRAGVVEKAGRRQAVVVPEDFCGRHGECSALRVRGRALVTEGIHDGDVLVVEKVNRARRGLVAVVETDGGRTRVGRLSRRGAGLRLKSGSGAGSVRVVGVVVALLRKYG